MRKILSFIFMILTISVMVFSEEMPKEVRYPSDKLSLTAANELLYDGQLYTGKILLGEKGYINNKWWSRWRDFFWKHWYKI